jgi:hypothetical protein
MYAGVWCFGWEKTRAPKNNKKEGLEGESGGGASPPSAAIPHSPARRNLGGHDALLLFLHALAGTAGAWDVWKRT